MDSILYEDDPSLFIWFKRLATYLFLNRISVMPSNGLGLEITIPSVKSSIMVLNSSFILSSFRFMITNVYTFDCIKFTININGKDIIIYKPNIYPPSLLERLNILLCYVYL